MHIPTLHLLLLTSLTLTAAQTPPRSAKYVTLPPLRLQAAMQDRWRQERLDNIPNILSKYGVDAWLMTQREHTEDTVFWSLKEFVQFSARRRTVDLFVSSPVNGMQTRYSWIDNTPGVWRELEEVLGRHDPKKIVVNWDSDVAFAGGLHVGEMREMEGQLGQKWRDRFVGERMVAVEFVGWMGGGGKEKEGWYKGLMETAWGCIGEAFSEKVVEVGRSSTEDVEWWLRDQVQSLNYTTWFQPDVSIVTPDSPIGQTSLPSSSSLRLTQETNIINYGDMLHVDFGVTALGMNTDTQHLAYVLYPGETAADIPKGLKDGLKKANRLQDILIENMVVGMSGNEILKNALKQMRDEGIEGRIYSHPIGDWGHSAGTLIGMTNLQDGVPILGDLPLLNETWYSIELYAEHFVPERNATFNFYLEEDVYWDSGTGGWEWVWRRQEEFHLVHSPAEEGRAELK